ncbi:MAG: hypothetical protein DDT32_02125 [Syntrophomonadaceae bacterium]|nr:hypothetical protein [Bacillota bacterium]MBT9148353.1 hypothetical protein [Bacillota bacterium]
MAFKVEDKVVSKHDLDLVGVVRSKHKGHYLVEFLDVAKWQQFEHARNRDLLPIDSPLIEQVRELDKMIQKLERDTEKMYEEKTRLLKLRRR